MEERHLSLSEAADALNISERTAYRWIKSGKLRAYKPGRDYWIPESAIREVVEESVVRPKTGRRSPSEPSFNDVLAEERRSAAVDGMVGVLELWHARRLAQVKDPASPHFRDTTAAATWIADTREDTNAICRLLGEWGTRHSEVFESAEVATRLVSAAFALDGPADLGEMRLREMGGTSDELAARRMERATADAAASRARVQELGKAANG